MTYNIEYLPREVWRGHILHMDYTTTEHYAVRMTSEDGGFHVDLLRRPFPEPVSITSEMYDYPDKLYDDYRPNATAYGVIENDELVAAIEIEPEEWSRRLRVTELWIAEPYRRRGIGHALMEKAKSIAVADGNRAVILETQTCNVNAIGFYLHEGFKMIGLDTCCYKNDDIARGEVRLEMGWFPQDLQG